MEKNATLVTTNATFPSQKNLHNLNKEGDNNDITLFGIPIIFVILIGVLILCVSSCIVVLMCRCRDMFSKKECKHEVKKENKGKYNKKIEMSQAKNNYYCGHIEINSLD